jgi:hypothetical protein
VKKTILIAFLAFFPAFRMIAQDTTTRIRVLEKVFNGDTLPMVDVNSVVVMPSVSFDSRREMMKYQKLVYNVRIVYPYAKMAAAKLREYQHAFDTIRSERKRRAFIKQAEKDLEAEFGETIKNMTFSQGKILIKLIDRETGNSSFTIVKELRGGLTAFVWQTMAKLFGYDLKTEYDPTGEDQAIERIVTMIEAGAL